MGNTLHSPSPPQLSLCPYLKPPTWGRAPLGSMTQPFMPPTRGPQVLCTCRGLGQPCGGRRPRSHAERDGHHVGPDLRPEIQPRDPSLPASRGPLLSQRALKTGRGTKAWGLTPTPYAGGEELGPKEDLVPAGRMAPDPGGRGGQELIRPHSPPPFLPPLEPKAEGSPSGEGLGRQRVGPRSSPALGPLRPVGVSEGTSAVGRWLNVLMQVTVVTGVLSERRPGMQHLRMKTLLRWHPSEGSASPPAGQGREEEMMAQKAKGRVRRDAAGSAFPGAGPSPRSLAVLSLLVLSLVERPHLRAGLAQS